LESVLDDAKKAHTEAIDGATSALTVAFDNQIKTADAAGDADASNALSAQRKAFVVQGLLPNSPMMSHAVIQFLEITKAANDNLAVAYTNAIEGFDKESKVDLAAQARRERVALLSNSASPIPAASGPTSVPTTQAIGQDLAAAKSEYHHAVDEARKALVSTIDRRLNAAADAGNLTLVKSLQAAKSSADSDGTIPGDVTEPAVLAAKNDYDSAVQTFMAKLSAAYQTAVHDYTRSRQIDMAQATQDELDGLGIVESLPAGAVVSLRLSPKYLATDDKTLLPYPGGHHAATIHNANLVEDARMGWAAEFHAKDAYVLLGPDAAFQMSNEMTVAATVMVTGSDNQMQDIVAKEDWTSGEHGYVLRLADGKPEFAIGLPGWPACQSTTKLGLNRWYFVVGCYDGVALKLYVDGELVATKLHSGHIAPSKSPLMLGKSPFVEDRNFQGKISEVKLFNKALSTRDIVALNDVPPMPSPFRGKTSELIHSMTGKSSAFANSVYVLNQGDRISTTSSYSTPVAFRLVAQTNSTNVRIAYAANEIIFNWEMDPTQLRIDGGPANGRHKPGAGGIPINQWVTIDLVVKTDSMDIAVDGDPRYHTQADFSKINEPLAIFPNARSIVQVKSLLVGLPK
jgi:hypothetical protein